MKTRIQLLMLVLLGLILAPTAQAYYNSSTGRWLSRDPIGEKGGKAIYASVANNPLNQVDALGLNGVPAPAPIPIPPPSPFPVGPGEILKVPFPKPPLRLGPPQVTLCIIVAAAGWYVGNEIGERTGFHDAAGDWLGDLWAGPILGGATGTWPGSPLPAGSRDPLTLPKINPGPCNRCGTGCKPCPPNSPAWEVNEPGHGSSTTHWHWIEYHQIPATYSKPGSKLKPCDCIPIRQSSPTKPPGA